MCTGSGAEKPRATLRGGPLKAARAAALALLVIGAPARAADSFSTDWAPSAKSQARLIAAGAGLAGFEIKLAPGAITLNFSKVCPSRKGPDRVTNRVTNANAR